MRRLFNRRVKNTLVLNPVTKKYYFNYVVRF